MGTIIYLTSKMEENLTFPVVTHLGNITKIV